MTTTVRTGMIRLSATATEALIASHERATEIAAAAIEAGDWRDRPITVDAKFFVGLVLWPSMLLTAAVLGQDCEVRVEGDPGPMEDAA